MFQDHSCTSLPGAPAAIGPACKPGFNHMQAAKSNPTHESQTRCQGGAGQALRLSSVVCVVKILQLLTKHLHQENCICKSASRDNLPQQALPCTTSKARLHNQHHPERTDNESLSGPKFKKEERCGTGSRMSRKHAPHQSSIAQKHPHPPHASRAHTEAANHAAALDAVPGAHVRPWHRPRLHCSEVATLF
eukprot:1050628-Amphidinium_carterae.1